MGDFNRKGTSVSKIMTYDRYITNKKKAKISCDDETNFIIYFRLNMSTGVLFNNFKTLTSSQQINVLKQFISKLYCVSVDKIIIGNIIISSIQFKATVLRVPSVTENISYDLNGVKNSIVDAMNVVVGTTLTNGDLDPQMTYVKDNVVLTSSSQQPEPEPEP